MMFFQEVSHRAVLPCCCLDGGTATQQHLTETFIPLRRKPRALLADEGVNYARIIHGLT